MSSHLNEQALDDEAVENLNMQMAEIDDMKQVESMKLMEEAAAERNAAMIGIAQGQPKPKSNPYKLVMLDAFRNICDPFGKEISGKTGGGINADDDSFDYEANPAEPEKPRRQVQIASYAGLQ